MTDLIRASLAQVYDSGHWFMVNPVHWAATNDVDTETIERLMAEVEADRSSRVAPNSDCGMEGK